MRDLQLQPQSFAIGWRCTGEEDPRANRSEDQNPSLLTSKAERRKLNKVCWLNKELVGSVDRSLNRCLAGCDAAEVWRT
jgi:hypothetical protein